MRQTPAIAEPGFAALGCWALRAKSDRAFRPWGLSGTRWMVGLGAVLLLLTVSAQKAAGAGKEESALVRRAPADAQWISCGNYYQVIPFLTGRRTSAPVEDLLMRDVPMLICELTWLAMFVAGLGGVGT